MECQHIGREQDSFRVSASIEEHWYLGRVGFDYSGKGWWRIQGHDKASSEKTLVRILLLCRDCWRWPAMKILRKKHRKLQEKALVWARETTSTSEQRREERFTEMMMTMQANQDGRDQSLLLWSRDLLEKALNPVLIRVVNLRSYKSRVILASCQLFVAFR